MNVKRFIITINAALFLTLGLLCSVVSPARADAPVAQTAAGEIIIGAAPGMTESDVRALAESAKCDFVRAIPYCPGFYVARLKSVPAPVALKPEAVTDEMNNAITTLKQSAGVTAGPNYIRRIARSFAGRQTGKVTRAVAPPSGLSVTPNDPLYPLQWGLPAIRMPEAWAIQSGTKNILVGVADSGINLSHPDFALPDGTGTRIVASRNFSDASGVPNDNAEDANGHGTHVAGTIGATTNNNTPTGVASVAGWNRNGVNVRLVIARVFDATGAGTIAAEAAGIGYLVDQGVNVINLSLGGPGTDAVETAVITRALNAKIVVVAALGNDNTNTGATPFYPANFPGVIAVSAVGIDLRKSFFSNYGGNVTIAAPGGSDQSFSNANAEIWSTFPPGISEAPLSNFPGYQALQGTSMASPHVAGAVALLLAAGAPQDPVAVTAALQNTAQPLDETPNNAGGNNYGAGLLDVYSALLPYTNPPFTVVLNGAKDRGTFYASQIPAIQISVAGVTQAPPIGTVKVDIVQLRAEGEFQLTEYVDGRDFTIPRTVPTGQPLATPFTISVPASGSVSVPPGRYKVVLRVNDVQTATQFFDVAAQTQPSGRAMFAFPFRVRDVSPSNPEQTVFGPGKVFSLARYLTDRGPTDPDYGIFQSSTGGQKDRRGSFSALATDQSVLVAESTAPTVSIAPVGLGYWLDLNDSVTLNTVGSAVTNPVRIKLYANNGGWNMVGAPFTGASGWGTISIELGGTLYSMSEAIRRNYVSSALIGYVNGDYDYNIYPYGQMDPFHGYWVRAFTDCTMVIAPTSSSRSVAPVVVRRGLPTVEGWRARLAARAAGDQDGQNYFGQAKGAADGADALDIVKPPTGGGHAYLRFVTDKDAKRAVAHAFDMKASDSARSEWTAAVSADRTNADVTITWDNLGTAPRRAGFTLMDPVSGKQVDMRTRSSYTFNSGDAGSTRYLKITMTPTLSAGPLAITNVSVAGGRSAAQSGFTVRFNTTAESDITGEVKALNGKVVAPLSGATRAVAGSTSTLRWDGRSRSGSVLAPGPYLVEITARTADGQFAKFVQPIQNVR